MKLHQKMLWPPKFAASIYFVICSLPAMANPTPHLPNFPYTYETTLPQYLKSVPQIPLAIDRSKTIQADNRAALGRVLFYDLSLSANKLVSCASCHKQDNGFDDPTPFSLGFKGLITKRNAMGLTNARFNANNRYFWDERAHSLEAQTLQPFFDPIEMGLKRGQLVARVKAANYYPNLFQQAYGSDEISRAKIAAALATYVAAIVSINAPYDVERAKVDNPLQRFPGFTRAQNRGKFLFFAGRDRGGAGCINCHYSEAFISLAEGNNNGLDLDTKEDQGVGAISQNPKDMGKFRPPSLRNIAVRAPYMHDGRFETLEQVIDHYSTGIKDHPNLGAPLKRANGKPVKFNFTPQDKQALIAFLKTLTDDQLLKDPKFSNPFYKKSNN